MHGRPDDSPLKTMDPAGDRLNLQIAEHQLDHTRPMSSSQSRPASRGQSGLRLPEKDGQPRVLVNCIVDDTALVQGAKKSTRDGIRKWVAAGQIRLFVPLYSLGQTSQLKERQGRLAADAEEALMWLDDATSKYPTSVTLQGGYEQFESWPQVERFALPKTLFSEGDVEQVDDQDLGQDTNTRLHVAEPKQQRPSFSSAESMASPTSLATDKSARSISPLSPPTSPPKRNIASNSPAARPQDLAGTASSFESGSSMTDSTEIPNRLRPLFNYILWRVHQEKDAAAALETFVFLTDDPRKRRFAQQFGIRCKSLADIRYVIAREGQEARNRQLVQKMEAAKVVSDPTDSHQSKVTQDVRLTGPVSDRHEATVLSVENHSDDEEEILIKRAPEAPAAMRTSSAPRGGKIMDPNQFSRQLPNNSPRTPGRGNGKSNMRGSMRGLGYRGGSRGGLKAGESRETYGKGPIDPDSFSRPIPNAAPTRGHRRLWTPS